jgi:hypothetical protein
MTKGEALYFLEGLTAGLAAPDEGLAKGLFVVLAAKYGLTKDDFVAVRAEVNRYLDEAEKADDHA